MINRYQHIAQRAQKRGRTALGRPAPPLLQLLAVDDALDVGSDHELLVRRDDENLDLGILGGQAPSAVATQGITGVIHLDAHKGQTIGHASANGRSVLADAGGKDQGVHAAHGGGHLGGLSGNLVDEHIEGELSLGVTSSGELLNVAAVVGLATGHSQKARLLVHHLVDLVEGVATLALQVAHGSRVDGAAAGAHHDAVERRQAHGGVHALAVLDGAQGSAGADMAHDDLAGLAVGHLGDLLGDVAIAGAVGAVLTDVQLVANILGKGVGLGDLGHVEVESGVVDRDVGQIGILLQAVLDNVGLGVVVQRRQRGDLANLGEDVLVDEGGITKVPTALNDTVADALDP